MKQCFFNWLLLINYIHYHACMGGWVGTFLYSKMMMMKHMKVLLLILPLGFYLTSQQVNASPVQKLQAWKSFLDEQTNLDRQAPVGGGSIKDNKCKSNKATDPGELAGLKIFYSSTGGANWVNNNGWLSGDPCTDGWFGVCCNDEGHVIELNLPSNQLIGQLPESLLTSFSALTALRLTNNYLTGSIPRTLFQTKAPLEVLELGYNQLEGELPDTIKIPSLVNLTLSNNNLGGVLPITWSVPRLQIVSLSSNRFEGALPDSLQSVKSLVELDVSSNFLSGSLPFEFGNLVSLEKLWLFENEFTSSEIPPNWLQMKSMKNFQMNGISGNIPSSIGTQWPELEVLILVNGKITGSIPTSMCNLKKLKYLHIFYNNVSDIIPECLCSSEGNPLISIDLSNNQLTGPIPDCIGNLKNLHYLYLSNNGLTGSLPPSLGNLKNLYSLDVSTNRLSGSIPASFVSLKSSLNQFDLNTNFFSSVEDGLESFFDSISRRSCNLYGNPFDCPVPVYTNSCNSRCSTCNTGTNHTSCSVCVNDNQYCGWCNDPPNCLGGYGEQPYYPYTCQQSEWYFGKTAKCPASKKNV